SPSCPFGCRLFHARPIRLLRRDLRGSTELIAVASVFPRRRRPMTNKNDWTAPSSNAEVEIKHLVENTDLSPLQARELVAKHGADRRKLLEIARTMKAEG